MLRAPAKWIFLLLLSLQVDRYCFSFNAHWKQECREETHRRRSSFPEQSNLITAARRAGFASRSSLRSDIGDGGDGVGVGNGVGSINSSRIFLGRIVRLAARSYHPDDSKPSSPNYTPRKVALDRVQVTKIGVVGDYNHYRSTALQNTPDRAVSIVSMRTLRFLQSHGYPVQPGDLGENLLIEEDGDVDDDDSSALMVMESGQTIACGSDDGATSGGDGETRGVVLQITEPMTPCANLCKLSYINDPSKTPLQRVHNCKNFLSLLGYHTGLRGWYGKVIHEGVLSAGDSVKLLVA